MQTRQRPPVTERDVWIATIVIVIAVLGFFLLVGFGIRLAVWAAGG